MGATGGHLGQGVDALEGREVRDFVIEARHRFDRRTLHNHVSGLRAWAKFWQQRGRLKRNPFAGLPLPKLEKRLPKFLTEEQMKQLLLGPERLIENGSEVPAVAWRDRLAMELLYGGGLRVSELVALNYGTIDFSGGVARVVGKGKKERLCPLGQVALAVLVKVRNEFAPRAGPGDPVLANPDGTPDECARGAVDVETLSRARGAAERSDAAQTEAFVRNPSAQCRSRSAPSAGTTRSCPAHDHCKSYTHVSFHG